MLVTKHKIWKKKILFWILSLIILNSNQYIFAETSENKNTQAICENQDTCEIQDESTVYLFWREWCAHCKDEKSFLTKLENTWKIHFHYLWIEEKENKDKFYSFVEKEWIAKVLPLTFIWWKFIQWFDKESTTWKEIIKLLKNDNKMTLDEFLAQEKTSKNLFLNQPETVWTCSVETVSETCSEPDTDKYISVPFFWSVNIKNFWLWSSAVLLWFIDWFNPCAMWVLVMFLTALAQIWDKKKMFQIAWIFILAEAIMYYLILNVWMNTWDFIWLDWIITPIVWFVAFWAWLYFLYEWHSWDWTCKVWSLEQKKKTHQKIQDFAKKPMNWAIFFWILALAFSVNIIEFACSVWIPQTFTKILDINPLSFIERQFWISIYILFYMIDDFIVFAIAIYSIEKIWITTKYTKLSHLIWWILMVILWGILLLKPELLVF